MTEVVKEEPRPIETAVNFGPNPIVLTCPNCGQTVQTICISKNGLCVYLSCVGLALVGCVLGCCLIPFCVGAFKDVDHVCPNCKYNLGYYKKLG
ncbi:unnamed protein product [Rodentolepis nana]|uniref:LITAF domain-containing protein n=1 Tax=Rodentolepis nana TaxID=102285 RepID=A0A0R3T4W4_RODNA|nr:unnamed protein product [Rodentolepis nana]